MTHLSPSSPGHACPGCNVSFQSADHVAEHLNSETSCWPQDMRTKKLPVPPAFICGEKPQAQGERPPVASFHPTSDYIYGRASNLFEQMQEDKFAHRRAHNIYYPFKDQAEWELGQFLCWSLSVSNTERLLKLRWVSGHIFALHIFLNLP